VIYTFPLYILLNLLFVADIKCYNKSIKGNAKHINNKALGIVVIEKDS
jgi:hypothetical protein